MGKRGPLNLVPAALCFWWCTWWHTNDLLLLIRIVAVFREDVVFLTLLDINMFTLADAQIGTIVQSSAVGAFAYYVAWMVVTPFVNSDHSLQQYFPPREYGVIAPCVILCVVLAVSYTVFGISSIFESSKRDKTE